MNDKIQKDDFAIKEDSFTFVQADKKIHDVKFETKPTTFAKDALKRFAKNKSSVAGAIIIGILLILAIILPFAIQYDISNAHPDQALLPPKLFDVNNGFWDGTKKYNNLLLNPNTDAPEGFNSNYIVKYYDSSISYTNNYNKNGKGGSFVVSSSSLLENPSDKYIDVNMMQNYHTFEVKQNENLRVTIDLSTDQYDNYKLGEYRILLDADGEKLVLKDWSSDYGKIELNLSEFIKKNNINSVYDGRLRFELAKSPTDTSYIMIDSLLFESDSKDEKVQEFLKELSITNANKSVGYSRESSGRFPKGYWQATANKDVYQAEITTVSFLYDEYGSTLGDKDNFPLGGSFMQQYVNNGWCEYDFSIGPESFRVLNQEKCPVLEVHDQEYDESLGIYTLTTKTTYYKYIGYDTMPRFLFGTTIDGKDIVKLSFSGLRTSLLIAIISASVCFIFGLCWGAISGYFGGNIDIAMERFCEILGGVPWIVVMTLAILLFGNNIITFCLALCLTGWLGVAARTRTQFYRFKGREYVLASRTLGSSDKRLIFKHILPNALGTIVTSSVLMIPSCIFSEATLSYLNLGLQGVDSFGVVLSDNQQFLGTYPALIIFPAVIISLLMISFNLFGNGLRDALNPSLKGSE